MSDRTSNVAIYWDFENIQASLVEKKGGQAAYGRTKYQQQEVLIDVDSVMEYAATFGVVSINRAYCNWQWYGKYRESLLRNGLELIQLFHPGASAKNGGDIKLALDCTEDLLRFPHVDVVVIVGGDSDYLPLAQKIKALGKNLVGIGTQANTNRHWARSCHEFKFYEALIIDEDSAGGHSAPPQNASAQPIVQAEPDPDNVVLSRPEELLRRAILRLSGKGGDSWVLKGSIRPMMKRMDPTFDEEQHGARSFGAFIRKFENLLEVRAGRNDQEIRLRGVASGERGPEGGQEFSNDRSDREFREGRRRDRNERRHEAPPDRSPATVAERIARALGGPEETPDQEPLVGGNEMDAPRTEEVRQDGFQESRDRERGRGRRGGRDRDRGPRPGHGGGKFRPEPSREAASENEIRMPAEPRPVAPATPSESAASAMPVDAPTREPRLPREQPPAKEIPVPAERRTRDRTRGRKPAEVPAGAPIVPAKPAIAPVATESVPAKPRARSKPKKA